MNTKIHIVDCQGLLKIVQSDDIEGGCIRVRNYEDDGDSYSDEPVPVTIKETFLVITQGHFIRNYEDKSKLNARTMSGGGMREIGRLAYSYSVVVMTSLIDTRGQVWESDLIYSDAGIRPTQFDMYSYHVNEPVQEYTEWRLEWEVFEALNLTKILANYLTKADIRESKLEDLGL